MITKERKREINKAYRERNKDKINERGREYYLNNKEKIAERQREHSKKYRAINKDKVKKYSIVRKSTHWSYILFNRARARSRALKSECNLTVESIEGLLKSQNGKCHWLGVDMIITTQARHPLQVSIDRLDNTKGYTIDNIVLCTFFANMGRNTASVELFMESIHEIKKSLSS